MTLELAVNSFEKIKKPKPQWIRNRTFLIELSQENHDRLTQEYNDRYLIYKKLYKFVFILKQIPFYENNQLFDVKKAYHDLVPENCNEQVDIFLNYIENGGHLRSIANFFRGVNNGKSKSKNIKLAEACDAAKALLDNGVLPCIKNDKKYTNDFYYGAITQALQALRSLLKANTTQSSLHQLLKNELESFQKEYDLLLRINEKNDFNQWLSEMSQKIPTFVLNKKFLQGWNKRFRNLINQNKQFHWSLGEDAIAICKKYNWLYKNEDLIGLFGREKLLLNRIEAKKQVINAIIPDALTSIINPRYGNNSDKFTLNQNKEGINLSFNSILKNSGVIQAKIIPHKKTEIWKLDANKIPYTISFQRPADRTIKKLSVSEVSLYRKEGKFYVGLKSEGFDKKLNDLNIASNFFKTAVGNVTQKTSYRIPNELRVAFIDIGINPVFSLSVYDYNRSSIGGDIAVVKNDEKDKALSFGFATKKSSDQFGKIHNTILYKKIIQLNDKIRNVNSCLSFWKNITKLDGYNRKLDINKIQDLYSIPLKSLIKLDLYKIFLLSDHEEYDSELLIKHLSIILVENGQLLVDQFRKKLLDIISQEIKKEFNEIKILNRNKVFGCEAYQWLFAIRDYLQLNKSLTYSCRPPLKNGERRPQNDFKNLNAYFRNYSKDILNKAGSLLRESLIKYKIDICVCEDLEFFRTSEINLKETNKLLAIWSHRKLVDRYKQSLDEVGIPLISIDARHSSQLDPETNNWGARDNINGVGDKTKLWVQRNCEYQYINADISACDVLAKRFFTRFNDIVYLTAFETKDLNYPYVVSSVFSNQKPKERLTSYLYRITNYKYAAITPTGSLAGITQKQFKQLFDRKGKRQEFYRHHNKWLDRLEHKKEQFALFDKGRATGKVGSKTPMPLAMSLLR